MLTIRLLATLICLNAGDESVPRRVVKSFDFDEAKLGNFEAVPMNWSMRRGPGYPDYLEARFDPAVGFAAAPSMVMRLMGGNVAAVYQGQDVTALPGSDYQLVGRVRAQALRHARARISLFFVDRAMRPIEGSVHYSQPVGGDATGEWVLLRVEMPGGVPEARWVGAACEITQPGGSVGGPDLPRPIRREDVLGAAWFDDLQIIRLPRADLDAAQSSHVFASNVVPVLRLRVEDDRAMELQAELNICDGRGQVVAKRTWASWRETTAEKRVEFPELEAGWYHAELTLRCDGRELLRRSTNFVRLAPDLPELTTAASPLAILLQPPLLPDWSEMYRLSTTLGASAVKYPIWSQRTPDRIQPDLGRFLNRLKFGGMEIVGVVESPPPEVAARFDPSHRGLLDVLTSPPSGWRTAIDELVARHGPIVSAWQVGRDGDNQVLSDLRRGNATERIAAAVAELYGQPRMATAWNALLEPGQEATASMWLSLSVPANVSLDTWGESIRQRRKSGGRTWVVLEAPGSADTGLDFALAEQARRIVQARFAGAASICLPQPWMEVADARGSHLEPTPDYLVVRTMAQALRGTTNPIALPSDDGVSLWLFPRERGAGTVVAWRRGDSEAATLTRWYAGTKARAFDLFGRPLRGTAIQKDGSLVLPLTYAPVVITPVDSALLQLQAGARLAQPRIEPIHRHQKNAIILKNTLAESIRGRLRIEPPPGWQVEPAGSDVALASGDELNLPLTVLLPLNEPCGERSLQLQLSREGGKADAMRMVIPVTVTDPGVDMDALVELKQDRLVVRQRITNRGEQTLRLRGTLHAPGRAMLSRTIVRLPPGETAVNEYELSSPRELVGSTLRVGLEQLDGPRRQNKLLRVE